LKQIDRARCCGLSLVDVGKLARGVVYRDVQMDERCIDRPSIRRNIHKTSTARGTLR
jgi:hypothetical protein